MTAEEIGELTLQVLQDNGCDKANREALVRTIVAAECDGALSHGLFRIPSYVASLRSGKVDGHSDPKVDNHLPAIVRVDGDNGFAPLAIERGIPHLVAAARNLAVGIMAIA